jgi:hypothetical protein
MSKKMEMRDEEGREEKGRKKKKGGKRSKRMMFGRKA